MCGRARLKVRFDILRKIMLFQPLSPEEQAEWESISSVPSLPEIKPTNRIPVLRVDEHGRRVDLLRWGLVPAWAPDTKFGSKTFNARSETASTKNTFRSSWKSRRCFVIVDGFYEWSGEGKDKRPNLLTIEHERPIAMAGLWDSWTDKQTGQIVESCTILTREATGTLASIHTRMPIVLNESNQSAWLDPSNANPASALSHFITEFSMQPLPDGIPKRQPSNDGPTPSVEVTPAGRQMKLFA